MPQASIDTSDLAAKRYLVAFKSNFDKLNTNKLVNVPTSLKNLKTKVDDLDVPVDLKKLNDVVSKEVVKKTTYNKLNKKANNLENKISHDGSTLVQTNRYHSDKQDLEKKINDVENKIPDNSILVTTTVLATKSGEVQNKIQLFLIQKLEKLKIRSLKLVV